MGEWQTKTRVSPQVPYGLTHADIFASGGVANMVKWDYSIMAERLAKDERCAGPGLAAYFVKGAIDRGIPMHTGVNARGVDRRRQAHCRGEGTKDGKDMYVRPIAVW